MTVKEIMKGEVTKSRPPLARPGPNPGRQPCPRPPHTRKEEEKEEEEEEEDDDDN